MNPALLYPAVSLTGAAYNWEHDDGEDGPVRVSVSWNRDWEDGMWEWRSMTDWEWR